MIALARSKAAPASGLATAAATFAEAVRKLDFTIENERLRVIRAEIAKIDDVIAETQARCLQLQQTAEEPGRERRRQIADALLSGAGSGVVTQQANRDATHEEQRLELQDAIQELVARRRTLKEEAAAIVEDVKGQVRGLAQSLTSCVMDEANRAAAVLADCYSNLKAIDFMTDAAGPERRAMETVAFTLLDTNTLAPGYEYRPNPELVALHETLSAIGPCFKPLSKPLTAVERPHP